MTTLKGKHFSLFLPCSNSCPLPFTLPLGMAEHSLAPSCPHLPPAAYCGEIPLCFPLLLNTPNSNAPWGPMLQSPQDSLQPINVHLVSGPSDRTQHPGVVPQEPKGGEEAQGGISRLCCKDPPPTPSAPRAPSCHRELFQPRHHMFIYVLTNHCLIWGVPPWAPDQHTHTPRQGWAPHLCTTRRDSRLSAGVDCWSAEKRFKVLVAGRPESDAGREKRGISEFGTSPVQEPPGEGSPPSRLVQQHSASPTLPT